MLFKIWRFIQMWLPFWLILRIYRSNKALPANIHTKFGRKLKAIMITTDYGLLFSDEKYNENRLKLLREKQKEAFNLNNELIKEINELTMEQRELMYNREEENGL